jgi:endo-1,4-beta-D-glucanase Y
MCPGRVRSAQDPTRRKVLDWGRRAGLGLAWPGAAWPLVSAAQPAPAASAASTQVAWPLWRNLVERFMQADGRVIDHSSTERHSTSQGQSSAMFLALVADDRPVFDLVWQWSQNNLAPEGLDHRLPAWRWGRRADGGWGILDQSSAADADLWMAYILLEAQRLWRDSSFGRQASLMLERIAQEEVVRLPHWGAMLLPGSAGYALGQGAWRVNPSYTPLPLLARLAEVQPKGPWGEIANNTLRMVEALCPHGYVPDWGVYQPRLGFMADTQLGDVGSYDAIRVYLWAGWMAPGDRSRTRLLRSLGGMARSLRQQGSVPERVRTQSGEGRGRAPAGFYAALLPYLQALDEPVLLARAQAMLADNKTGSARDGMERPWSYHDHVLALLGLGFVEGRYRFSAQGQLIRRPA